MSKPLVNSDMWFCEGHTCLPITYGSDSTSEDLAAIKMRKRASKLHLLIDGDTAKSEDCAQSFGSFFKHPSLFIRARMTNARANYVMLSRNVGLCEM